MKSTRVSCCLLTIVMAAGLLGCDSSVHNNAEATVARDGLMPVGDSLIDEYGKVSLDMTYVADQATIKDVPNRTVSYEPLASFRNADDYVYIPGAALTKSTGGSAMAAASSASDDDDGDDGDQPTEKGGSIWGKISGGLKQLTGGGR